MPMENEAFFSRISVAPMMGCTDRHFRYLMRLITRKTLLYTEMVTTGAILHGNRAHLLKFDALEHPIAVQLGGAEPEALAKSAKIAEDFGYDEINLNVGCPSSRVQAGKFGACLMKQPSLVADCVGAMRQAVSVPVTVKCRIGVDAQDSYPDLLHFIRCVAEAGCKTFIIHARKAWLSGLNPRENRTLPPLNYDFVYALKADFPQLSFVLNGGVQSLLETEHHLTKIDGVMIGRAAYANPWLFASVDRQLFSVGIEHSSVKSTVLAYLPYVASQLAEGVRLRAMARHLVGLFQGCPGARLWRRHLSEHGGDDGRGIDVIKEALNFV